MIMPDGTLLGKIGGKHSASLTFCIGCHNDMEEETDELLFLPEEYRK
jgi:hypothetical protein